MHNSVCAHVHIHTHTKVETYAWELKSPKSRQTEETGKEGYWKINGSFQVNL